jgi:Fibronectin type III domain.
LTARWKETQGGDNPGGNNPGGDNPGGNNPGGDNSGGNNPGDNESQKPISISAASVKLSKITLTYTGKAQKPKATVTYKGKKLAANKDYTVSYSNNIKVGQSSLKVTGKGRYNGSKTVKFTIMPKKNKIVKLTAKKGGKLLVKLSLSTKKSGAKGYEISYSTKKSFKGAKKVKTSKTSYTLKKLKKGKTYYVRVRSYAKIGKKVKYGAYSKAMKKKVTK